MVEHINSIEIDKHNELSIRRYGLQLLGESLGADRFSIGIIVSGLLASVEAGISMKKGDMTLLAKHFVINSTENNDNLDLIGELIADILSKPINEEYLRLIDTSLNWITFSLSDGKARFMGRFIEYLGLIGIEFNTTTNLINVIS